MLNGAFLGLDGIDRALDGTDKALDGKCIIDGLQDQISNYYALSDGYSNNLCFTF